MASPVFDAVLRALGTAALGLVSLASVFAVYALVRRVVTLGRERRCAGQSRAWSEWVQNTVVDGRSAPVATGQTRHTRCYLEFLMTWAAALRGEPRRRLEALAEPSLAVLRAEAGDPVERAWVLRARGLLGRGRWRADLLSALDDPSDLVAVSAAFALAGSPDAEAGREILARLDRFSGWDPRFWAHLLGRLGNGSVEECRRVFESPDRGAWARAVAGYALIEMHDLASADAAARVLSRAADAALSPVALRVLAAFGRPEHRPFVRPLVDSPRPELRALAVAALSAVGHAGDAAVFTACARDPSPWVALRASEALRRWAPAGDVRPEPAGAADGEPPRTAKEPAP